MNVYVKFWKDDNWYLSKIKLWQYILGRLWGEIGPSNGDPVEYNVLRVYKRDIIFE